jgi:GT2 family glycosyltransferase
MTTIRHEEGTPGATSRPSLCVINYNGAAHLETLLGPLRGQADDFAEVVLVDDHSRDDSLAVVGRVWPDLTVIRRERNGGPGAARNTGAAALIGQRILFLDNDVRPEPRCVERLGRALDEDPGAVLAMPRVVYADEPQRIQFEGAEAHPSGTQTLGEAERLVGEAPRNGPRPVTSLVSACFLFDRERWGDHPLFDPRFQIYFEDHELGLRAALRGLRLLAVPDAVCRHGDGTPGLSVRATGNPVPARVRNTILNRWQVLFKLYQARTLVLLAPSLLLFELFQLVGGIAVGWLPHWLRAAGALGRMAPDLARRRRAFRPHRSVPDGVVLRPGPHPFSPALTRYRSVRALRGVLDGVAALNWALARPFLGRG